MLMENFLFYREKTKEDKDRGIYICDFVKYRIHFRIKCLSVISALLQLHTDKEGCFILNVVDVVVV